MKILVAEKLSEHRYKTPEGYLICVDSILARTGKQTYKRSEIFGDDDERLVEVDRKAEEVFSPETMASFENKPICVEHPDVDVNSGNISEFAVGFVRDIHKGEYEGEPVMLGTLVITDAKTVEEIEEGKHTDLSCGYDCDIDDSENPQQRNIRGNHVALCEQGRAGIARIMDSVKDEESTYTEVTKNLEKEAKKDMSWLDSVIKDSKQTFRVLATVPGDYDDEPGFDIIFNVKANSENEAIEKAKKYAEKTPAYRFAWDFRLAEHNQHTRIERNVDSVKDEQLYAVEFVYDGDSWSDYLGHVNVRAKSEQDALTKAKRWAVNRYDNAYNFKIGSTKYTNVETIDSVNDESLAYDAWNINDDVYVNVGDGIYHHARLISKAGDGAFNECVVKDLVTGKTIKTIMNRLRLFVKDSVKDAKTEYIFNYHDTYHGTRDKMRVDANNLDEAIREFGKTMALGGFGTANIYVVSVSPNDGYMRAYGKLSEMLKQKWTRDSVKDFVNDAGVKDSNDFVNSHEHRRIIYEFMETTGNTFSESKDKDRLLKYIEKETGIKNADWHDVMYIIKNHTRAKLFDEEIKDYVPFPKKDALNKSNGLEEIKRIINNKDNTFEDTEGMIYLTEKAYNDIKVVIKMYGITQKELEGISKYFFGPGGYNMFK